MKLAIQTDEGTVVSIFELRPYDTETATGRLWTMEMLAKLVKEGRKIEANEIVTNEGGENGNNEG